MSETALGILGALVIVGGMMAALELREGDAILTDDDVSGGTVGPPPALGTDAWTGTGCDALILTWNPPLDDLARYTHPWTPAASAVPDRGTLSMVAFTCDDMGVSGVAEAGSAGALVAIAIDERPAPENVSMAATTTQIDALGWGDALGTAFQRHGFVTTDATVSVSMTPLLLGGTLATFSVGTAEGRLDAQATFAGPTSPFEFDAATVTPREDRTGFWHGDGSGEANANGQALVTSTGTTWVSRLGLEPTPTSARMTVDESFDITLESRLAAG